MNTKSMLLNLSQSGCGVNKIEGRKTARDWDPRSHEQTAREWDPRTHESLMMIDSGASVNVCPKWFGNSKLEQSDGATCLRGANGKLLQENRKRQIWLKMSGQTKRYDFLCGGRDETYLECKFVCVKTEVRHISQRNPS